MLWIYQLRAAITTLDWLWPYNYLKINKVMDIKHFTLSKHSVVKSRLNPRKHYSQNSSFIVVYCSNFTICWYLYIRIVNIRLITIDYFLSGIITSIIKAHKLTAETDYATKLKQFDVYWFRTYSTFVIIFTLGIIDIKSRFKKCANIHR